MKKLITGLATATFLSILLIVSTGSKARAQDVTVSYQTFYDELQPYGQWVYDPEYGNVWVPNEDEDFRPYYSRGHWVMTEYGNTWTSNDPWGWACYHYGRWTYNGYYGWIWVPGYEWGPSWVSWRYGGGYCGWAPMAPGWSVGGTYNYPESWWVFVGPQYLYYDSYNSYWRGPRYNRECLRRTTVYNNVYYDNYSRVQYNYGPRASAIQRYTNQPVQVFRVSHATRPGMQPVQQNVVSVYRPNVDRGSAGSSRPHQVMQAPRNISRPEQQSEMGGGRPSAFRQEIQRRGGDVQRGNSSDQPRNTGVVGPRNQPVERANGQPADRFDNRTNTRQPELQRSNPGRFDNRTEVKPNQEQPRYTPQPQRQEAPRQEEQRREERHYIPQPKVDNPNQERPRQEAPRQEQPRYTPPPQRQEPPRQEAPRQEQPRYTPPPQRQEPPRQEAPRQEQPRYTPPQRQEPPRQEQPRYTPPPRQEPPRQSPPPPPPAPRSNPQPQPQPRSNPQPAPGGGRR